ncbi:histone family protein [Methanobrevibacter ruminantium]|nr:histone family protein [Methanobrevibacter ruminantium]
MMSIPVAPIGRIIKDAGAERVSEDAKKELNAYVTAQAEAVAKKAIEFAAMAKRKTVKAEDIELAIKNL